MHNAGFWALLISAVTVGVVHSLAPDHWAPFGAVARAQKWSLGKTARVSALAGFGHVSVSALCGVVAMVAGLTVVQAAGARFEGLVGYLLIAFGLVYALWGWRSRTVHQHTVAGESVPHHHSHSHHHQHEHKDETPLALFVLFCLDPCVAVVPIILAAAPLGMPRVLALIGVYELATICAITLFSCLAYAGAAQIRLRVMETHGAVVAGLFIAAVGTFVQVVGI